MPQSDLDAFRLHLRKWASDITSRFPGVPVLVRDLCSNLDVGLTRRESVPRNKAYLSFDPSTHKPPLIILPLGRPEDYQRFCVAHELAHYFLSKKFNLTPNTSSEYWQHEEICDDFARHLLIPDSFISEKLENMTDNPRDYLHLCGEIRQLARVPWTQAAIRIAESIPNITYLRCEPRYSQESKGTQKSISHEPQDFKIMSTTLPRKQGTGILIKRDWPLFETLNDILLSARISSLRTECDVSDAIAGCKLIRNLVSANEIVAMAEVKVAKILDIKISLHTPI